MGKPPSTTIDVVVDALEEHGVCSADIMWAVVFPTVRGWAMHKHTFLNRGLAESEVARDKLLNAVIFKLNLPATRCSTELKEQD